MPVPTPPIVIGLAGGTASGKTTAALALHQRLAPTSVLLSHDAYYRSLPPGTAPEAWNFDHPDALDTALMIEHLDALRQGRAVRVPRYDFTRHAREDRSTWPEMAPAPVILVEGILVLSDAALRERMDHRVYVHTPDDVRLVRRIRRDIERRGRAVAEVLDQYLATVRPMHESFVVPSREHADLVLDGTAPIEHLVDALLARVAQQAP